MCELFGIPFNAYIHSTIDVKTQDEIIEELLKGKSQRSVAKLFNLSDSCIYKISKNHGLHKNSI